MGAVACSQVVLERAPPSSPSLPSPLFLSTTTVSKWPPRPFLLPAPAPGLSFALVTRCQQGVLSRARLPLPLQGL